MNRVLRMTLVAALGMMTINSMAQVERPGETTVLDATWTEVHKPSATSDGDLHLAGNSVINFTIKDITKSKYSYSYIATLEVRSANETVKGTKYYRVNRDKSGNITWKVSDTKSGNWKPIYDWKDVTDVTDNSVEGSITVSDGATGDYLYMEISGADIFWPKNNEVILTALSSTTNRYDIYDHVGLFGEDTGTANIQSNRMKDHNDPIDVYVHRTIAGDGAWSTLCLPFDLNHFKVKKAFGDDIVYAEFERVDLTKKEIHFKSTTGGMTAGQPYLIQNSKATIDNFFADDVTFTKTDIEDLNKNGRKSTKESEGYYYVGLLEPTKVNNNGDANYNSDNRAVYIANPDNGVQKLKKLSTDGIIKAFRAYLYFPVSNNEFEAGAKESSLFLSLDDILDGGITGVDKITVDGKPVNNNIYNLNGQLVGTDASVLPQGIYVRNGKKFVIK